MWLTRSLTVVLAVSFCATVHGDNTCLTGSSALCTSGTTDVNFEGCGITDDDILDLKTCFDTIGRSDIYKLRLGGNNLTTIPSDLFDTMETLNELHLEEYALTTIPASLFDSLGSLEELQLQTNGIETIDDDAFSSLAALKFLQLQENGLTTIDSNLFAGLTSLQALRLHKNSIDTIEDDAFADLVALQSMLLNENALTTVQAGLFDNLGLLESLSLNINAIETIDGDGFSNNAALQELYLRQNELTTVDGLFDNLGQLDVLSLEGNAIGSIDADTFADLTSVTFLDIGYNQLTTVPSKAFAAMESLLELDLSGNGMTSLPVDAFTGLWALTTLRLSDNALTTLPAGIFLEVGSATSLETLDIGNNQLTTVPSNVFAAMGSLLELDLSGNGMTSLPVDAFTGLSALTTLRLSNNELTTLPAGIFLEIGSATSLETLDLDVNPDLQCVPTVTYASDSIDLPTTAELCVCTPADAIACDIEEVCTTGATGYNCVPSCADDSECDTDAGEVCCLLQNICESADDINAGACGDPHMTGFRGQKFDFTGEEGAWYAVLSDLPYVHLNMRVTCPVPSVPEITYITGVSIITTDADGLDHTIVITVDNPHSLDSSCSAGLSPCLADGALTVLVDGEETLVAPGEVTVAADVEISAVNLPGECRSFGFENYWESKTIKLDAQSSQKLSVSKTMEDMSDWILADPQVTDKVECAEYAARATADNGVSLFAHESEHASFQIMTPTAKLRLSHGRLHQLPMRDPTERFDLPDHLTWQMNLAIDHIDLGPIASGILGETLVPTIGDNGAPIMQGMEAIRGTQEDYRVKGPLGVVFSQGQRDE